MATGNDAETYGALRKASGVLSHDGRDKESNDDFGELHDGD